MVDPPPDPMDYRTASSTRELAPESVTFIGHSRRLTAQELLERALGLSDVDPEALAANTARGCSETSIEGLGDQGPPPEPNDELWVPCSLSSRVQRMTAVVHCGPKIGRTQWIWSFTVGPIYRLERARPLPAAFSAIEKRRLERLLPPSKQRLWYSTHPKILENGYQDPVRTVLALWPHLNLPQLHVERRLAKKRVVAHQQATKLGLALTTVSTITRTIDTDLVSLLRTLSQAAQRPLTDYFDHDIV